MMRPFQTSRAFLSSSSSYYFRRNILSAVIPFSSTPITSRQHSAFRITYRALSTENKQAEEKTKKSDQSKEEEEEKDKKKADEGGVGEGEGGEDFASTLNNIKKKYADQAKAAGNSEFDSSSFSTSNNSFFSKALGSIREAKEVVSENIRMMVKDLTSTEIEQETMLKKKFQQADSFRPGNTKEKVSDELNNEAGGSAEENADEKSKGPSAIVVVQEGKSAWEQMKERLQDSPFIRDILKGTKKVGAAAAETDLGKKAQNIGQNVKDKVADAREFWETSQNPLVYTLSGIWDNLTGPTEEGLATAAFRRLDPAWSKEEWAAEVRSTLVPKIIKAQLEGNLKVLKPWLGEAVFNKLAADIKIRKSDGIEFDSNILNIDENAIVMKVLDDDRPIVVVVYMVQQINCIRKRGEIIEGSETDIRAKFYSMAFQQLYDEDTHEISWQIVDYEFAGDIPYY